MNTICKLFNIKYPIIQGGMVWCSGWKLASAVSNQGGLGLLGTGSMHPEVLQEHIHKMKKATNKPWGVNLPLLYPELDRIIDLIIDEEVKIVFTSAGSPKKWTSKLKSHGITVVHVVSSSLFAKKCEDAGVDAIVAEGFEAGGHNGREETTTLSLIPQVRKATSLPLIAAGGIGSGQAWMAAQNLGADGVQIGSLFAVAKESSAHPNFKKTVFDAKEGDTKLSLKGLAPVRLLNNEFFQTIYKMEQGGASSEELKETLGKGRAKKGMFLGELDEGELEIGQVSAMIQEERTVQQIFEALMSDYLMVKEEITNSSKYQF
ncbi:nitronate monooxygenase [Halosquirtibacter xylanolyticus]|uniref:NAD(P)H-dependent flavin oxidoreductase n=1 Tax=Halosquirtibacter xylanolyticus TaxID=3374599 RepID=UPI00374A7174|nr:nitronate monooxygenase [Prolixibacteraceae bacterium]